MLIDWFTVGAQALNFLVLVWLLRHFLYRPILKAVEAREARIAKELADAAASKAETAKQSTELGEKIRVFDQERAGLLSKATDEAKVERLRLIGEAQKAADVVSVKRNEAMKSEARSLNQAIGRRTQQEVFAVARRALTDLATTSLEERIGEVFTRRLRTMDGQAKALLGEALKTASVPSLVRSAFDLPPEQRAAIQNAVNETFSADIRLRFETAPDVIGGIELVANGQRVAWSIANYLGSLERDVSELMKKTDKPATKAEPKPEADVEAKSESKVEAKTEATVEPGPKAKVEAKVAAKVEPEPTAKVEPEPKTKVELSPEAKVEPELAAKGGPEPKAMVEPNREVKTEAEPKDEVKPKSEANVKPQPAVKPPPDTLKSEATSQ